MIEDIVALIPGNELELTTLILGSILTSQIISQVYWRGILKKRDKQIIGLEASVEKKDADLYTIKQKAQELLYQSDNKIKELNNLLTNNEHILDEKEKRTSLLNSQLVNREKNVSDLTLQLDQQNDAIANLKKQIDSLNNTKIDTFTRVEIAETKVVELEKTLAAKKIKASSLRARINMMQDDFTRIYGIGPKVSLVLRSSGINNFARLASTDVSKIVEILKDENPGLLRLTDPSSWPEQSKLASEEDWEALSALQEKLKKSKRV